MALELLVEQQFRLCEDKKTLINKLNLENESARKRDVLYIETTDRFYQANGWVIRIKTKNDKVDIDLKKRFESNEPGPSMAGLECELDKHGDNLGKTCKINNEISLDKLEKIILNHEAWSDILSSAQKKWLTKESVIHEYAQFYGTLKNIRHEFDDKDLGKVSLDLVHLDRDESITYHEISIRYPISEDEIKTSAFLNFIKRKNLKTCSNQDDWQISKFDVMLPVVH